MIDLTYFKIPAFPALLDLLSVSVPKTQVRNAQSFEVDMWPILTWEIMILLDIHDHVQQAGHSTLII
jgi:hypothetical protein